MGFLKRKPDPRLVTVGLLSPGGAVAIEQALPKRLGEVMTRALLREPNTRVFIVAEGATRVFRPVGMDWADIGGTGLDEGWFERAGLLAPVLGIGGKNFYGYAFLADSALGRSILRDWDFAWATPVDGESDGATAFMLPAEDMARLVAAIAKVMLAEAAARREAEAGPGAEDAPAVEPAPGTANVAA